MPPASRFGDLAVRGEDIIHDPAGAGRWHIEDGTMNEPIRLLVVMDPIDHIKYQKDTTLGLLLAAQRVRPCTTQVTYGRDAAARLRVALRGDVGPHSGGR